MILQSTIPTYCRMGTNTPSELKNKMVDLHTTTTKVKIDHTIRPLLTHMAPPGAASATLPFSQWK